MLVLFFLFIAFTLEKNHGTNNVIICNTGTFFEHVCMICYRHGQTTCRCEKVSSLKLYHLCTYVYQGIICIVSKYTRRPISHNISLWNILVLFWRNFYHDYHISKTTKSKPSTVDIVSTARLSVLRSSTITTNNTQSTGNPSPKTRTKCTAMI